MSLISQIGQIVDYFQYVIFFHLHIVYLKFVMPETIKGKHKICFLSVVVKYRLCILLKIK